MGTSPDATTGGVMFCPGCGTRRADDASFCSHCGRQLEGDDAAARAAAADVAPTTVQPAVVASGTQAVGASAPSSSGNVWKVVAFVIAAAVVVVVVVWAVLAMNGGDSSKSGADDDAGPTIVAEAAVALADIDDGHDELAIELDGLASGGSTTAALVRVKDLQDEVEQARGAIGDLDTQGTADEVLVDMIGDALDADEAWLEAVDTALRFPASANRQNVPTSGEGVEESWKAVDDASDGEIAIEPEGSDAVEAWLAAKAKAAAAAAKKRAEARRKARAKARAEAAAAAERERQANATVSCATMPNGGWPVTNITATGTTCTTASAVVNGMSGAGSDTVSTGWSAAGYSCSLVSGDPAISYAGQSWNYSCSSGSSSVIFTMTNPGG